MIARACMIGLGLMSLAACTSVGPNYEAPRFQEETAWIHLPTGTVNGLTVELAWWTVFQDAQLDAYIQTAMAENRNLKAAEARVTRAAALRQSVRADYGPRLDAEAGASRQRVSQNSERGNDGSAMRTLFDAGLSASWEIDLFGSVRRADEAAEARVQGAVERERAIRLSLLAEVARNYFAIRGTQKRIANTEANIDLQAKTFALVENLFTLGEASEFDVTRARGQLQLTQSRLPELDAEMRVGIYRLSVLLGQPPGVLLDELEQSAPLPEIPDVLPMGQASDLLRRRPDVRAAERDLAAATADIGTATADLFPRFNLLGALGRSADTVEGLRSSMSTRYLASSFIRWPIFQAGLIRAQIDAEEAEAIEAIALYEQTVLEALADAESALIRYLSQRETKALLADAVISRQRAVQLARSLFNGGEENFLSVLDAERELLSAQDDHVLSETEAVLRLITLYASLGGGWDVFEPSNETETNR